MCSATWGFISSVAIDLIVGTCVVCVQERESERDITILLIAIESKTTWADWWVEIFTCNWTHTESHIIYNHISAVLMLRKLFISARTHTHPLEIITKIKKNNNKLCYFYHFHRFSSTRTHPAGRAPRPQVLLSKIQKKHEKEREEAEEKIEENNESIKNPCGLCGCWNSIDGNTTWLKLT